MAHKKAGSTAKTNRDSNPQYLGVKKYGGEAVNVGNILIRQKGTKFHPGINTKLGNDFTIYALRQGVVKFKKRLGKTLIDVITN
jgi:large subunit ribosomal protein L27